jgi:hypothetical protein
MAGPVIKISAFSGEQPRIIPRLLPDTGAKLAIDVRLDDGGLTPVRQDMFEDTLGIDGAKTIYRHQGTWLAWDTVVHASPGPVASERLYYTGDTTPKMLVSGTEYDLALAGPSAALTATLGGSGSGDVVTRVYTYTYVTSMGEESEPAAVSNKIDWKPGNTVVLSGFLAGPAGRGIATQRIYRSQTGQLGTYFYLIAERAVGTGDFNDTVAVDAFQEPLPSEDWNPPPDGLQGLTSLPNGSFVGFVDRQICFSEPYRPHAWPEKYRLSTTDLIVGLGAIGGVVVVLTEGYPVVLQGSHPAAMSNVKLELNAPCINERSIVDLGFAVVFATNDGLASVRADGSISLITANLFSRDDWLALNPTTIIAAQISGRYVAFYDTVDAAGNRLAGALFFDLAEAPFLVRSASQASAASFSVANGGLYFVKSGTKDIYRFDAPSGVRKNLYWRSKEFMLPYDENFGAIRIDTDPSVSGTDTSNIEEWLAATIAANNALIAAGSILGEWNAVPYNTLELNGDILTDIPGEYLDGNFVAAAGGGTTTVGIYANGKKVASIGKTDVITRLPSGFLARKWEIEVAGNLKITQIAMGKSPDDLKENG